MHASYISSGPGFELGPATNPWVLLISIIRKTLALLRLVSLPFHGHTRCDKPLSQEDSEIFHSSIISFLFFLVYYLF